ncbi:MAG: 3-dehydroquinate synthase family protein [Myxococcota bacterium]
MRQTVRVATATGGYDVVLAPDYAGLAAALPPGERVLVTEATVGPLWAGAVREAVGPVTEIVAPAGEVHKDRETWGWLCDRLLEVGVDRHTAILALGGGVLGDLAGFAAATTLRGLAVVQLPTTLLAMVDSSVGGKVGVNHPRGKNLIGAFHPPAAVWMALETLSTLPDREHRCGWGEILKTALAADAVLFEALEGGLLDRALADRGALAEVIAACVRAKAAVVAADEREAGLRMVLNAGHTAGHALETALGHGAIAHGEAVAVGLALELDLAAALGVCEDPGLGGRLDALLARCAPAAREVLDDLDRERFVAAIGVDKKAVGDKIRVPLAVRAGEMRVLTLERSEVSDRLARLSSARAARPLPGERP